MDNPPQGSPTKRSEGGNPSPERRVESSAFISRWKNKARMSEAYFLSHFLYFTQPITASDTRTAMAT